MEEENHEQTLLIKREVFIYRIPPRPNAAGYKAQDWSKDDYVWDGRLVIVARGDLCVIRFEDKVSGELYAECPVDNTSVEPVLDSSRYFVIKVRNGNQHAFLGMGFTERNDAFDFSATIQDHQNFVKNKKEIEIARKRMESEPKKDYSLKQGQTIHIPFKQSAPASNQPKSNPFNDNSGGGGGFLLAPPPGANNRNQPVVRPTQQQQQQSDPFSFSTSSPQQQQQFNQQQQQQFNQFNQSPQQGFGQFNQPQQQQQFGQFNQQQQSPQQQKPRNDDWGF
eukprot:gene12097-14795_t